MTDKFKAARKEITTYREQRDEREQAIRLAVAFHRAEGVPWSVIAEALGVTKQSAHRKYRS